MVREYKNEHKNNVAYNRKKRMEEVEKVRKEKRVKLIRSKRNIASAQNFEDKVVDKEMLLDGLTNIDATIRMNALLYLRRKTANDELFDDIIGWSIIPALLGILDNEEFPTMQRKASKIILDVSSGNSQQTQSIVAAGALDYIFKQLHSPNKKLVVNCLSVLKNFVVDSDQFLNFLIEKQLLQHLNGVYASNMNHNDVLEELSSIIREIFYDLNTENSSDILNTLWPIVTASVLHSDSTIQYNSLKSMLYLIKQQPYMSGLFLNEHISTIIMNSICSQTREIVDCALKIVYQLSIQSTLSNGILKILSTQLSQHRSKCLAIILSISLHGQMSSDILIEYGLFRALMGLIKASKEKHKKMALNIIGNIELTKQGVLQMMNLGFLYDLSQYLECAEMSQCICSILEQMLRLIDRNQINTFITTLVKMDVYTKLVLSTEDSDNNKFLTEIKNYFV